MSRTDEDITSAASTEHTPEVRAITAALDGRWAWVRERSRREQVELVAPLPLGLDMPEQRALVRERMRALGSAGYARIGYPREVGGAGDLGGSVTAFEMLGFGELSLMVKAGVQWGLFGGAIEALGTERHRREYLPQVMTGELLGCFAMTETGHGSDVQSLGTTATFDPQRDEFVVHTPHRLAWKDYIGGAAHDGRLAVVFAQLRTGGRSEGVHAFLVPLRDHQGRLLPGVTAQDDGLKAGLNGVDNGRLAFDQVRVPRANLLDRYAQVAADGTYSSDISSPTARFFTMLGTLVRGRISVAGAAGSATKAALTIAVRYGSQRRQFDRPDRSGPEAEVPVLDYLAHQRLLLPALARSYALHFAQGELVSDLHDLQAVAPGQLETVSAVDPSMPPAPVPAPPQDPHEHERRQRELETRAAGMKAIATWHATSTIQTCREACGGAGYLAENRLPQLKADTDVFTTFEGANPVLLQLVAKGLATQYRDHVGDLNTFELARFLAEQVVETVRERAAPVRTMRERLVTALSAQDDEDDLFDREWQREMIADREEHLLDTLARRLRRATGERAFAVFNRAQDHVLALARAHMDRLLIDAFDAGVQRCVDPAARALLDQVCDLFALSTIEADRAWFLEHGRLSTGRSRAVTRAVNDLCGRVRPHAVHLVDAFAVPDQWLACELLAYPTRDGVLPVPSDEAWVTDLPPAAS